MTKVALDKIGRSCSLARLCIYIPVKRSQRSTDSRINILIESFGEFPAQQVMAEIIRTAGLVNLSYSNVTFGIACIHRGKNYKLIHRRDAEAQSFYFVNSAAGVVNKTTIFSSPPRLCGKLFLVV